MQPLVTAVDGLKPGGFAFSFGQARPALLAALKAFLAHTSGLHLRFLGAEMATARRYLRPFETDLVLPMTLDDYRTLWSDLQALVHSPSFNQACQAIQNYVKGQVSH